MRHHRAIIKAAIWACVWDSLVHRGHGRNPAESCTAGMRRGCGGRDGGWMGEAGSGVYAHMCHCPQHSNILLLSRGHCRLSPLFHLVLSCSLLLFSILMKKSWYFYSNAGKIELWLEVLLNTLTVQVQLWQLQKRLSFRKWHVCLGAEGDGVRVRTLWLTSGIGLGWKSSNWSHWGWHT